VLNAGFQKGGVVSRLQKVDGDFVEIPFEAYAPRALAGISRITATLEERSLFLAMIRKRKSDRVERLPGRTDPAVLKLRAQAALAMLTHIGTILQLAPEATQLLHEQEEIDDRAVDLYTPLLTLALVADGEDDQGRAARLLEVFGAMGDSRNAAEAEGPSARLLRALADIAQGQVPPYEIRPGSSQASPCRPPRTEMDQVRPSPGRGALAPGDRHPPAPRGRRQTAPVPLLHPRAQHAQGPARPVRDRGRGGPGEPERAFRLFFPATLCVTA
jgi:hypothetical protein